MVCDGKMGTVAAELFNQRRWFLALSVLRMEPGVGQDEILPRTAESLQEKIFYLLRFCWGREAGSTNMASLAEESLFHSHENNGFGGK